LKRFIQRSKVHFVVRNITMVQIIILFSNNKCAVR
jgi:hypothetical protein